MPLRPWTALPPGTRCHLNILKRKRDRRIRRSVALLGLLAFGAWMWTGMFAHVRNVEATMVYPSFEVAAEPLQVLATPGQVIRGTMGRGQSIYGLLARYGLAQNDVAQVLRVARPVKDLARVGSGDTYRVRLDERGRFRSLEVDISGSRMMTVAVTPFGYFAESRDIAFETRLRNIGGAVTGDASMFPALMRIERGAELVRRLSDIYAWEVDFRRDIQPGDSFEMLVDEIRRDGQLERFGDIRWVRLTAGGVPHEAMLFEGEYYGRDGVSLRHTLLPTPVAEYHHVSSRYSEARRHPVYGFVRPHHGVDFVARWGAPVRATGDGVVLFAGWKGDNGYMVSVRHDGVYRSGYAHLSRIPDHIKRGARVRQGQVIGFVGNSGASTGTHLHYAIYRNGLPMDPLKLDYTPVFDSVDVAGDSSFTVAWDEVRLVLDSMHREQQVPGVRHVSNSTDSPVPVTNTRM